MAPLIPDAHDAGAVSVTALTYHTVNHTDVHNEGDVYSVDDPALLNTLIGIGFVDLTPAQPKGDGHTTHATPGHAAPAPHAAHKPATRR